MIRAVAALLAVMACGGQPHRSPKPPPPAEPQPAAPAEPRRTTELDRLFGDGLPRWVVALNNQPRADPRSLREAAAGALPAEVAGAFDAVLAAAGAARQAPEPELDAAADRLTDAVAELDRQLAAAHLGYVVDATVVSTGDSHSVLLFSFAVDRLRRYASGNQRYRSLWVTRIDQLAYRYTLVGLAAQRRDVLILTAQIDEWLVRAVLPALADPASWRESHEAASAELAAAVAAALERELAAVAGAGLAELSGALDARDALFDDVAERLGQRGVTVERPATLVLAADWRAAIETGLTAAERERLAAIETRLAALEVSLAYARVRELAIAAVEHHEIQHQIDAPGDVAAGSAVDRVAARERSAYLAQIARHPASAHLSLVKLAGFALSARTPPVERVTATEIIGALARHLGLAADTDSSEAISVATTALLARDGPELSTAAAAVWKQRLGKPLAPLALE